MNGKKLFELFVLLFLVSSVFFTGTRMDNQEFIFKSSAQCVCLVNITAPEDGSIFTHPDISILGYATEECGIVYIALIQEWENGTNSSSWSIETPSTFHEFEFPTTLHEGWNKINISAEGACGATGSRGITLYYFPDDEAPSIHIEHPTNGSVMNTSKVNIVGEISDNIGISSWGIIHISNGKKSTQVFTLPTSQQEISIEIFDFELAPGKNIIKIFAEDGAGNNETIIIELTVVVEEGLLIESVFQPVQVVYQSDPLYGNDMEGGPCSWNAKLGMVAGKNTYLFGYPYDERNQIKIKVHNNYSTPKTFSFIFKIYPDNKEIWRSEPVTIPAKTKQTFTYQAPLPDSPFQWERKGRIGSSWDGSVILSLDTDPTKPPADYHCEKVIVNTKVYYTHDLKVLFVPFTFRNGPDFPDELKIPRRGGTAFDRWRWNTLEPWWLAIYPLREGGLKTYRNWLGNLRKSVEVDGVTVKNMAEYQALTANQRYKVRLQLYKISVAAAWMGLYDRIVFLVHPDIMGGANGMAIKSDNNGDAKQGVIVNWSQRSKTAAHEVGHTYGLDESYTAGTPYKAVGYWVNKKRDITNSENNKDLMWRTYPIWEATERSWIKKPNFKILLRRFNQHRDPMVLGIVGLMNKKGNAVLYPWYKLDKGDIDLEWGRSGEYLIRVYDDNDTLLAQTGFNISFVFNIDDLGEVTVNESLFAFRVEWINGTSKVEIMNASSEEIIATRKVSQHSPEIHFVSPSFNESIEKGLYEVRWNTYDKDGGNLTFNLFISNDTKNWFPLDMDLQNNSFFTNFSFLSSGTYWIKVIATDGINTGSNISRFSLINISFTINITSPYKDKVVSGIINISGKAYTIGGNIKKVEIKIDDEEWQVANGTTNWYFILDTSSLKNGEHSIYVRAYDGENYSHIVSTRMDVKNKIGKGTPGFEIIAMVGATLIVIFLRRKKK